MTDSDPRSDPLRALPRARKMREVWSNHATRHRNLRELLLREGLEAVKRYLRRFIKASSRGGLAAQVLVLGNYEILQQIVCGGMGVI